MQPSAIAQAIREQIAEGETEAAAERLTRFLGEEWEGPKTERYQQLYNQALNLRSRFSELRQSEMSGVVGYEQAALQRNQIRNSLLQLTQDIDALEEEPPPTAKQEEPATAEKQKPKKRGKVFSRLLLVAAIIIAGFFIWNWVIQGDPGKPEIIRETNPPTTIPVEPTEKATEETAEPVEEQSANATGCRIKTSLLTNLYNKPDLFQSSKIRRLPRREFYQVMEVKKIKHAGSTVHFFQIQADGTTGWVKGPEVDEVDPSCY